MAKIDKNLIRRIKQKALDFASANDGLVSVDQYYFFLSKNGIPISIDEVKDILVELTDEGKLVYIRSYPEVNWNQELYMLKNELHKICREAEIQAQYVFQKLVGHFSSFSLSYDIFVREMIAFLPIFSRIIRVPYKGGLLQKIINFLENKDYIYINKYNETVVLNPYMLMPHVFDDYIRNYIREFILESNPDTSKLAKEVFQRINKDVKLYCSYFKTNKTLFNIFDVYAIVEYLKDIGFIFMDNNTNSLYWRDF